MSSFGNGPGSHFAPSAQGDRPARPGSTSSFEVPRRPAADSTEAPMPAGSVQPGAARPKRPSADDTLFNIYSDMPFASPNGSDAARSSSVEPMHPRSASPSDTDVFLAVAASSSASGASQPSLTPAASPVSFQTAPSASSYATPSEPSPFQAHAQGAQQAGAPAGPVNPLVAARNNNAARGAGAQGGLFPIQEVEATSTGRGFDTSFGEPGHKRGIVIAIIAVILLAAVIVGAFFFLRGKEVADAQEKIDQAIELLRKTDEVIVPLDSAIAAEISTGVASEALSNLMLQSSSTATNLSSAEQLAVEADRARGELPAADVDAIDAVKDSVSARRSMLEIGRMLLSTDTAVTEAVNDLAQAYGCIANANAAVQSSVEQFDAYNQTLYVGGDTSVFDLWALVQLDIDARDSIVAAQGWVDEARAAFPSADLSVLDTYLAARLTHLNLLIDIDTLIANGDYDTAGAMTSQLDEANWAQQVAAEQVPATAAELLTDAYSQSTAAQREGYVAAREKCVTADAVLNEYLGIPSTSSSAMGMGAGSSSGATPVSDATALVEPQTPAEPLPDQVDGQPEGDGEGQPEGTVEG